MYRRQKQNANINRKIFNYGTIMKSFEYAADVKYVLHCSIENRHTFVPSASLRIVSITKQMFALFVTRLSIQTLLFPAAYVHSFLLRVGM